MKWLADTNERTSGAACRRGFTLIEAVAVLPAVGLLTAVIGAALMLIARSASDTEGLSARAADVSRVTRRVAADVTQALAFSQLTPTAVEFRVPDRTGNGREDVIRYSWSGTPGAPLLYALNQQSPVPILDDVQLVVFTPQLSSAALEPLDEELAVIAYHNQAPESHTHDYALETSKWCAQCFDPVFPPGTTTWAIKRVRFMAKRDGDLSGVVGVRIEARDTLDDKPRGIVLEEGTVAEMRLDKEFGWVDVDFTSLIDLDPSDAFCLVLNQISGSDTAAKVVYEHGGSPMTSGTNWLTSSSGGSSWSDGGAGKDMRFYILGTYDTWTPTSPQYVAGVHMDVQAGSSPSATVELMVSVVNPVEFDP